MYGSVGGRQFSDQVVCSMKVVVNSRVPLALSQIVYVLTYVLISISALKNQKHPSVVQLLQQNQHVRLQKFPYGWVTNKKLCTVCKQPKIS